MRVLIQGCSRTGTDRTDKGPFMVGLAHLRQARTCLLPSIRVSHGVWPALRQRRGLRMRLGGCAGAGTSAATKTAVSARRSSGHCEDRLLCGLVEFEVALVGGRNGRGAGRQTDVVEILADGVRGRERGDASPVPSVGYPPPGSLIVLSPLRPNPGNSGHSRRPQPAPQFSPRALNAASATLHQPGRHALFP